MRIEFRKGHALFSQEFLLVTYEVIIAEGKFAGVSGLEPEMEVLETSVIPFHHTPIAFYFNPSTSSGQASTSLKVHCGKTYKILI